MRHLVVINFAPCRKELNALPEVVREDLADALAKLAVSGVIHLLCGFKKTTRKSEQRHIELAQRRLKEVV